MRAERIIPYLLILPLTFILGFVIYSLLDTFRLSLHKVSFLNPTKAVFVGFNNYIWLFTTPSVYNSYFIQWFSKSIIWVLVSVSLKVIIGLGGALILNEEFLGRSLVRTLTVMPWAIPWAMAAMMWAWVFNNQYGILDSILIHIDKLTGIFSRLGIKLPLSFIGLPLPAFVSCIIADVWAGIPFMTMVFLAGLQAVPKELYDAAVVDGASMIQRFRHVTLPQIKPIIVAASLFSMVWTFNSFDFIWVLTQGGPLHATETIPIAVYNVAFRWLRAGGLGKGSAISVMQIVVVSIMIIFYLKIITKGGVLSEKE